MPFDDSDDLDAMFDVDDFATAATYDSATTVNVIFDREYLRQLGLVSGNNPVALGKASDFPEAAVTKTLEIDGTTYTIRDRELQDDGATVVLQLEGE